MNIKRRSQLTVLLWWISCAAFAQHDYLVLTGGTVLQGHIKMVRNINNGEPMLELWRTKTDRSPVRYYKSDIDEFAMAGDTFKVLKNFQPFDGEDYFLHDVEAKVVQHGRIELLRAPNPYYHALPAPFPSYEVTLTISLFNKPINDIPEIYILHTPRNRFMRGIPEAREKFAEALLEFFTIEEIESFV